MSNRYKFTLDHENRVISVTDTETGKDVSMPEMRSNRQDAATMMPATRPSNVIRSAAAMKLRLGIPAVPERKPHPAVPAQQTRQDAAPSSRIVTSSAELRRRLGM